MAGGYYVFEAADLDEALGLAGQIPAASYGAVEIWPMAGTGETTPLAGINWLALLLEPPDETFAPGSAQWEAVVARHHAFGAAAGDHVQGGAGLHPSSTATSVTVRDGRVSLTDGPFVEGAEVANGFYVLSADDRDEAVKIASMIPATTVELRQLAGVSVL